MYEHLTYLLDRLLGIFLKWLADYATAQCSQFGGGRPKVRRDPVLIVDMVNEGQSPAFAGENAQGEITAGHN